MGTIFMILIAVVAIGIFWTHPKITTAGRYLGTFVASLFLVWALVQTSLVIVGRDDTGHITSVWIGKNLPPERQYIALDGEKGPRASVLGPGFHFIPGVRIWGRVDVLPVVEIPAGSYGEVTALDGKPLPEGYIAAPPIPGTSPAPGAPTGGPDNPFDATTFLTSDYGYKGVQTTVLKPGKYRMNLYAFNVKISDNNGSIIYDREGRYQDIEWSGSTLATEIEVGEVGVVKSNITELWQGEKACAQKEVVVEQGELTAKLVPPGCQGVWSESLKPGAYFLNRTVYSVTNIETRAQRWTYKGGYDKCTIDLTVGEDGSLEQKRLCIGQETDPRHADRAIYVKVEGWDIPVELRILVQVTPDQAPGVVASVGALDDVENRIVTPAIRSIVRNIGGGSVYGPTDEYDEDGNIVYAVRPTRALDFAENRDALETAFEKAIVSEGRKAGITILEVKMGEPAIPPELLLARRRDQLADQLKAAYIQEQEAQTERIAAERAKAEANQQDVLVKQQIETEKSELYKIQRANQGEADRDYLLRLAEGERARASVLGQENVTKIEILKQVLAVVAEKPEIINGIKLPDTMVLGGNGLEGFASILNKGLQPKQ